jgi:hypothetical protein
VVSAEPILWTADNSLEEGSLQVFSMLDGAGRPP